MGLQSGYYSSNSSPKKKEKQRNKMKIGIDLGGTKIEYIVMDNCGKIIIQQRIDTPRGCYKNIVDTLAELIHNIPFNSDTTIGIGIPGSLSPTTGLVRGANTTELNGQDLKNDLQRKLTIPVRIANDANCFALSEAIDGAGKNYKTVFGVIIGTGTGGGLIIDKRLIVGEGHTAGEWGHNSLPWPKANEYPGPLCYCGKKGCIETFLSGPGLSNNHYIATGKRLSPKQIVHHAQQHQKAEQHSLQCYCDQLARGLASIINTFDPAAIVLGGGMSNIQQLYDDVPQLLQKYCFTDEVTTTLLKAQHGDSSGVRGAAWLWK